VREAKSRLFMRGSKRGREREKEAMACVRECEKERAGERESYDFRERKIKPKRERAMAFPANLQLKLH
jgi:hypothetical protein